jgi:DNA-binding PadR family transcriptional regulator
MKLNIDTVKSLLAVIEESPDYPDPMVSDGIQLTGTDSVTIVYHLSLMLEAGLIRGKEHANRNGRYVIIERLTWEGHAFLANAQNPTIWERFKGVGRSMGSFSLDVAKATLTGIAQQIALQTATGML